MVLILLIVMGGKRRRGEERERERREERFRDGTESKETSRETDTWQLLLLQFFLLTASFILFGWESLIIVVLFLAVRFFYGVDKIEYIIHTH